MSQKKLTWTNEKRKLKDLIPWEQNPRQIRESEAKRLADSYVEFSQVETIAIGPENEIYNGHQRLYTWADKFGPDLEVDVRVSTRKLTTKERQKLTVFLHEGAVGEWDFDTLANWDIEIGELVEWGFDRRDLGILDIEDWSDLDKELAALAGMEEVDVKITIPSMYHDEVIEWLANGEQQTSPGMGKGVLRRCGLL